MPLEIVSVDSAAVYRHMDIGTAKPPLEVRRHYPHHLVDILNPDEAYSAGAFFDDAARATHAIKAKGKIPLLVGGTMMYFHILWQGLSPLPPKDPDVRDFWIKKGDRQGWGYLHALLQQVDPAAADKIDSHDRQRIARLLEIYALTGQPWSVLCQARRPWPFPVRFIGWDYADRTLHKTWLEKRFSAMMAKGLLEEVRFLFRRHALTGAEPALKAVGYHEACLFLQGKLSMPDLVQAGVKNTKHLVKRQRTGMRKLP
jgi:tRNA dimethylallyltransferase